MSVGAAYTLSANEGKMSSILNATALLNNRINARVAELRRGNNRGNVNPSLRYIEQTHILYVNAHFKPYAAIQQEYDTVRCCNGQPQYGQVVQFNIPQFGDFFADMGFYTKLPEVTTTSVTTGYNLPDLTNVANNVIPGAENIGVAGYSYRYVDSKGTTVAADDGVALQDLQNYVKYCDFPGLRLLQRVAFTVNNSPLDDYYREDAVNYERFGVPADKRAGFNRLVGQESATKALSDNSANAGVLPLDYEGTSLQPVPSYSARQEINILSGPQTPRVTQPALELLVPLFFWFCKDTRLSVPSVSIPPGQRFIDITLAQQADILCVAPSIAIEEVYENAGTTIVNVRRTPYTIPDSNVQDVSTVSFKDTLLYVNNLFMNASVHNIYIDRVGFQLIRVHRRQIRPLSEANDSILLNGLKWPIETMYGCLAPSINARNTNPNHCEDWYKCTYLDRENAMLSTEVVLPAALNVTGTDARVGSMIHTITAKHQVRVLESMDLEAQGNKLFKVLPNIFWNAYTPYMFGGQNVITPSDSGALMVNFALYPGSYQPSGYLNLSRSREVYVNYNSNSSRPISNVNQAQLQFTGTAINFLLIADGGAVLRFST